MMQSAESLGAVPQAGVNPAANNKPQDPRAAYGLTDADLENLRADKEVAAVFAAVAGQNVPMERVDAQSLAVVAGMVHKLGVDGAVAEINKMLSPEQKASLQADAAKSAQAGGQP